MDEEDYQKEIEEPTCPNCGLRSYNDPCPGCGFSLNETGNTPKENEDEDDVYDWRERR